MSPHIAQLERPDSVVSRHALAVVLVRHGADLDRLAAGISTGQRDLPFFRAYARARRRLGDAATRQLELTEEDRTAFSSNYPGFDASTWSVLSMARVWLLLGLPANRRESVLAQLLRHADIDEQVAVYRGLYLLENAESFGEYVAHGVRTNVVDVFDAVALHNPISAWLLDDTGWAQLALKAVFMGRPLYRIVGFDERRTDALAHAAHQYAHERWSAGRSIQPELWRMLAGTQNEAQLATLRRARADDDTLTARAASWALGERDPSLWHDGRAPTDEAEGWLTIGREAESRAAAKATRDVLYPSPSSPKDCT